MAVQKYDIRRPDGGGRRLRRALLEPASTRRCSDPDGEIALHHPPRRGRDRVRAPQAAGPGARIAEQLRGRRDGGRGVRRAQQIEVSSTRALRSCRPSSRTARAARAARAGQPELRGRSTSASDRGALRRSEEQLRQVAEDGGGRPAGRRHRARLQQPADGDPGLQRRCCSTDAAARRAERARAASEIKRAGERAAELTRQLLAFSRQQVLEPERARPERRCVRGMETDAAAPDRRGHRAHACRWRPSSARVKADPGQIEQVMMNLVVNARDAMPDGGKLTIETANVELDEDYAREHLGVDARPLRDAGGERHRHRHGRGDAGAHLRAVLHHQGARQGHRARAVDGLRHRQAERRPHLGLQRAGQGTTFKIYLPAATAHRTAHARRPEHRRCPRGTETILLVEDDDAGARGRQPDPAARRLPRARGANAGEALLICERAPGAIHLLLTDVVMPQDERPRARRAPPRPAVRRSRCSSCPATPTTRSSTTACSTRACLPAEADDVGPPAAQVEAGPRRLTGGFRPASGQAFQRLDAAPSLHSQLPAKV